MMELSVILPCYNAADTIYDQLHALSQQSWDRLWEVIVIDNCCDDESISIVKKFKEKIPNLRIIEAYDKKGAAYARNKGANSAHGRYLAFCDADDVVGPGWIAAVGNALDEQPFIACHMEWAKLNNFSPHELNSKVQTEKLNTFYVNGTFPHAGGGSLAIRKEIHLNVGGFDESMPYLEDTDYCIRVQLKGNKLMFIPNAIVHIRARKTNSGIFKQEFRWAEYGYYLYKRYRLPKMGDYTIKKSIRRLYSHFRGYQRFLDQERRSNWVIRLAIELGRIKAATLYYLLGWKG